MDDRKREYLLDWLERHGWHRDTAEQYVGYLLREGLHRDLLGLPFYAGACRALLDYHASVSIDQWQAVAPHLREHLRSEALRLSNEPYAASDREETAAVKLGAALEELSLLIASCPAPDAAPAGPLSRPSALGQ